MPYGRNVIGIVGTNLMVLATDLADAIWKPGGITVEWDKVAAVSGSDVTLVNGTVIKIGKKYIPAGTVMDLLTSGTSAGKYMPYLSTDTEGGETVSHDSVLLNEDLIEEPPFALVAVSEQTVVGGLRGGTVWFDRLQIGGAGQPSVATFEANFPQIEYAKLALPA